MGRTRLFHISEQRGIERFDPRPSRSSQSKISGDVVWAVAESHLYNYFVPRDCPRVSFFARSSTRNKDVERFLEGDRAKRVLATESCWFSRILGTALIQYEFDPDNFSCFDETAGYYLSQHTERPVSVQMIPNPLEQLLSLGIEVRLTPSLWQLRERVFESSLGFSFIRMDHATPRDLERLGK